MRTPSRGYVTALIAVTVLGLAFSSAWAGEKNWSSDSGKSFSPKLLNANTLIGAEVTNPQGESLGHVEDVVLNAQRDKVSYVAIGKGGLMDIADEYVAVPWEAMRIETKGRDEVSKVLLHAGNQEMEQAEGFSDDNWPSHGDMTWLAKDQRSQTSADDQKDRFRRMKGEHDHARKSAQRWANRRDMQYRRLTEITGLTVKNLREQNLGNLEQIVLDLHEGRPVYGVISFGGWMGWGDKMAAIPWSAMDVLPMLGTARTPASQDVLEAIAFEQDSSPNLAHTDRAAQLHSRFDEEPYWQTFGYVQADDQEQKDKAQKPWKPQSQYNARFDTETMVTKQGTIQSVGSFRPAAEAASGLRLRVKTADDKTMTIHAGPRDYASKQGFRFHYGDRIRVSGSMTEVDGHSVVMAKEIHRDGKTLSLRDEQGNPKWTE